jgi:hemerythrin superfamily protein
MPDLSQTLLEEHARLDEVLNGLACAAESADHCELLRTWGEFEKQLRHHLEIEESKLFPVAEPFHPEAVESLRRTHDKIRAMLSELGVRAELHTLRKPAVDWLVETLRQHAEQEDRTLYHWVNELAPEDTRRHFARLMTKTIWADLHSGLSR